LFKKRCILFKSPFLGLWCLTRYIQSITQLCSVVDFSGSLAPLALALPVIILPPIFFVVLLPVFFVVFLPVLFVVPLSALFVVLPSSSSSSSSFGGCGAQFAVVGFVHSPGVFLSGGRVVWYRVVVVVMLWGALLRRSYCRGGGCVVVVVVKLSWWWLCCCCGVFTVVVVVMVALSSWCRGPRYTCVGVGCSSLHPYGAPSSLRHPRLGFCCRSPRRDDLPTLGLNPQVVI